MNDTAFILAGQAQRRRLRRRPRKPAAREPAPARRSPAQQAGDRGEDRALDLLARAGLRLLARNLSCRAGEIDLVMRDGGHLVFVEVRYRRRASHGSAAESVSRAKRARLVNAARWFLMRNPKLANLPCRFDVVAVDGEGEPRRVEWLRDAFRLDG